MQLCPDGDPKVIRLLSEGFLAGVKGDPTRSSLQTLYGQPRFTRYRGPTNRDWKVERPQRDAATLEAIRLLFKWLSKELTASFQSYSYYHALPDQMQF